jgi:hypothetical protein
MQSWTVDIFVREQLNKLLDLWWQRFKLEYAKDFLTQRQIGGYNHHYADHLWLVFNSNLGKLPVDTLVHLLPQLNLSTDVETYLKTALNRLAIVSEGKIPVQWSFAFMNGEILATGRLART